MCFMQVRLAIAEKGLECEEYDVSLPLSEHNEPWFMKLNPAGEVPVLVHNDNVISDPTQILDYLEQNFKDGKPLGVQQSHSHQMHVDMLTTVNIIVALMYIV